MTHLILVGACENGFRAGTAYLTAFTVSGDMIHSIVRVVLTTIGGNSIMTKTDLIDKVAEKSGLTKRDSQKALEAFVAATTEALRKGDKIQLVGFGSFEVHKREARKGRNPQTGAEIKISARKVPVFRAGKALKDSVVR
jgi:DNA-binding protein HU-beta